MKLSLLIFVSLILISCGGSNSNSNLSSANSGSGAVQSSEAPYQVLMMGNSHTSPIPRLLMKISQRMPREQQVYAEIAPGGMYLFERMIDQQNLDLLNNGDWTHVVLQALKYSSSGQYTYSTRGAEVLIDVANAQAVVPILFPEHPRTGNTWESSFLYSLHSGIANEHPACVSPIGFVWEDFMSKSSLNLHQQDGNHASNAGAFLTALVIYQTIITRDQLLAIPYIPDIDVEAYQQGLMRSSVQDILSTFKPCQYYHFLE